VLTEFRHLTSALLALTAMVAPLLGQATGKAPASSPPRTGTSQATDRTATKAPAAKKPPAATPPRKLSPLEKKDKKLREKVAKWAKVDWKGLVKTDQLKFLQLLRQKCEETIIDFTATFHKQERINGKLRKEEIAEMKWRRDPFSVYMKFTKGDKGKEALYVEGVHGNEIRAHTGGFLKFIKIWTKPTSKRARKNNLRPITGAGMANMLHAAVPVFEEAKKKGDLKIEYIGIVEYIVGRRAYQIKRILPKKIDPKTGKLLYPCKEFVLYIDTVELVPVGADSYHWDGQVISKYRYKNFKINIGLTDKDFDWKNKAYGLK